MGRPKRCDQAGYCYHMLNRANLRAELFKKNTDYDAFESLIVEAIQQFKLDLFAYCLMPNHWHMVANRIKWIRTFIRLIASLGGGDSGNVCSCFEVRERMMGDGGRGKGVPYEWRCRWRFCCFARLAFDARAASKYRGPSRFDFQTSVTDASGLV